MHEASITSPTIIRLPRWPIWFAKESEQDLDFDDEFVDEEDDDVGRHKPPSRRPLVWILVILLVIIGVYWALSPNLSEDVAQLIGLRNGPKSTVNRGPEQPNASETPSSPTYHDPRFQEGQQVTLALQPGKSASIISLRVSATSMDPGPTVVAGQPLIIVDGTLVDQGWMYLVRAPSGDTGWIPEEKLAAKS